ncbi:glucose-6-phosphate 1-dehydrogenase [Thermoflexales bacterium]|nr:glucose-6-phosphate 1-dehydrogenase [Thermoflexales bacterium]
MNNSRKPLSPFSIVIFGATGDLTHRKILPAFYAFAQQGLLPEQYRLIGFARRDWTDEIFRAEMRQGVEQFGRVPFDAATWDTFAANLYYHRSDFDQADGYPRLGELLDRRDTPATDNRLFYLATPPESYPAIVHHLGEAGLNHGQHGWTRIIIEKPFGRDLPSAIALNQQMHEVFAEEQVYRIDHYLGKETVQNLIVFRFANAIFEPIWNRNYIDHVQLTVAETVGVESRAGYYDTAGVGRDILQNHLLQLLTVTAMEPPYAFDAHALRDEKAKVLQALRPIQAADTVAGQYIGYRNEQGVAPKSQTPTFVAVKMYIDNWRWQGVPFFLRSGKQLADKTTEISIVFKRPPHSLFPLEAGEMLTPNVLTLCIQPDEGMHLRFEAKVPGANMQRQTVDMNMNYAQDFSGAPLPEAYERLLLDALQGDASLFTRADEIELAWQAIDPVIQNWENSKVPLFFYEPGSWGPYEAVKFMGEDRLWRGHCGDYDEA